MTRRAAPATLLALVGLLALPSARPVAAQSVGTGVDYLGYQFGEGLNADAAQLFMIPVAVRYPVRQDLSLDFFSAWAEGRVEQNNNTYKLSGLVDTNLKGTWQATPWAQVAVGINLPTGNSTHTDEEAVVASVLSTDLLGFREASWGTGFAITSSAAAAKRVGGFGLGIAAAYAARSSYEPSQDVTVTYQPGNETRIRAGLDYNFGNSTLTAGGTFISYQDDKYSDAAVTNRNLFRAGNRIRVDASYAFRAAAGVWSLYVADLMRANGDLRVDVLDDTGIAVGDTTLVTAKQNLFIAGMMGSVALGGGYVFRPHVDYRLQKREENDGNDAGSGWIIAAGGDIPMRVMGNEFFPKARVYFGSIKDAVGGDVSLLALEFKGTVRVNF